MRFKLGVVVLAVALFFTGCSELDSLEIPELKPSEDGIMPESVYSYGLDEENSFQGYCDKIIDTAKDFYYDFSTGIGSFFN